MSATATSIEVRERPIIFSGPMVKAILEGRKTQTRRVVKGLPKGIKCASAIPESNYQWRFTDFATHVDLRCPYGRPQLPLEPPRDRLWVRETFSPGCDERGKTLTTEPPLYRADDPNAGGPDREWQWVTAIYMPRWASRLSLGIVDVRVERVQEITEADAKAEGIQEYDNGTFGLDDPQACMGPNARQAFWRGWDYLNAKRGYSWESNPWVWAIIFKIVNS